MGTNTSPLATNSEPTPRSAARRPANTAVGKFTTAVQFASPPRREPLPSPRAAPSLHPTSAAAGQVPLEPQAADNHP